VAVCPSLVELYTSGMLKRLLDIVGAAVLLFLTSPVFLLAAGAIKAHDRGPILFRQMRVGKDGQHFAIYKFRSMVQDADKIGGYATAANDGRITPIGRVLRRFSIDELPQLINVLKGDMSLVGPRPDVAAQTVLYSPADLATRQSVRPGVTGLAQAMGRSTLTMEERTRLDLEYVDRRSTLFDAKILGLTMLKLFKTDGN
jgi:lipopolysaccharide/colanic/teichoic acid biosynthesis glycosyltransferase